MPEAIRETFERCRDMDASLNERLEAFAQETGQLNPAFHAAVERLMAAEELIRERTGNRSLVLFDSGDEVTVHAGEEGMRFLLVSGRPIEEPIAWYGPIVMNTQAELQRAFAELNDGTFIKQA